jgi:sec-independent protein translocase protein TatA
MGTPEIILICVVVIVVFGSTKLPQLGDGLGRAIKNFKRAVSSNNEIDVSPKKSSAELGKGAADATEVSSSDKKTTAVK